MRLPTIRGIIDRRVLVNFRVAPDVLSRACPAPFRPQIINGFGIAGICLIRLKGIRPKIFPRFLGISSENAAHRIAVQWDSNGETRSGVYIPRRDTSSWLNSFAGGRIFPGVHHLARFNISESKDRFRIEMRSHDRVAHLLVDGQTGCQLPEDSIFSSIDECSRFFEEGSVGYSPDRSSSSFDGLELRTKGWSVCPLNVGEVASSFFEDRDMFPEGSAVFDNALLMQNIDHEWHTRQPICCESV